MNTSTFLAASFASMLASCMPHVSIAGSVPSFLICDPRRASHEELGGGVDKLRHRHSRGFGVVRQGRCGDIG